MHFSNLFSRLSLFFSILLCVVALSVQGCAVDDDDDNNDSGGGTEPTVSVTVTTDGNGRASTNIAPGGSSSKFGLTIVASDTNTRVRFIEISRADGTNYLNPGGTFVSFAQTFEQGVNSASIPSRDADPSISGTDSFTVTVEAVDSFGSPRSGETITIRVNARSDSDLNNGTATLNVYFVGDIGQSEETKSVTRAALDRARSIFSGAGVQLNINEFDIGGGVSIPVPIAGDDFYLSNTNATPNPSVNAFIAGEVGTLGSGVLGVSSGIPAPAIPSRRSAYVVSIFSGAGPDGSFSDLEIRTFGETIAHEAGHYMGLFHPIDFSGNSVANVDPLTDTATCSLIAQCLSDESLTRNLMFPSTVSDNNGGLVEQSQLTGQQRGVMNRFIAVD